MNMEKPKTEGESGYPQDFIERVKAEFPDSEKLHQALEAGSDIVGRYLNDYMNDSLRPENIANTLKEGRQQEILEAAEKATRIQELYKEFLNQKK
ncbi:MAG: hypothetical protein PHO91_01535 [Patescibacteria group bacterium]|nr:hypothetical protein [Patescibacteria group bacterium]